MSKSRSRTGFRSLPRRPDRASWGVRGRQDLPTLTPALTLTLTLTLAALAVSVASAQGGKLTDDTVVARVGSEGIVRKTVTEYLLTYVGQTALHQLNERSMLRQDTARYKVAVTEADVNARGANLKKSAGFQAALDAEGITEDAWRERIRYGLLTEKLLDRTWPVKADDLVRLSVRYARLQTKQQAQNVLQEAKRGVNFETLVLRDSEDKANGGLVQPDPFLRIEYPYFFKLTADLLSKGKIRVGGFCPEPIQSKQFWLVIRLEKRLGSETLTGEARQSAIRKIREYRMRGFPEAVRKRYRTESPISIQALIEDPKLPVGTEVSRVSLKRPAGEGEAITRKDLVSHLYQYFGKLAIFRLTERTLVAQEAAKLGVSVTASELDARVADARRTVGETSFLAALAREGISEAASRERARYNLLAEKALNARSPVGSADLERLTVRYVRVATREQADQVIRAAQSGIPFQTLVVSRSLDRFGEGLIPPRYFLRVDNPVFFKLIDEARPRMAAGDVLRQPVEAGGSYWVLKLEGRFTAEMMTAKERDDALRRINASRMGGFLEGLRKSTKVDQPVSLQALIDDARGA